MNILHKHEIYFSNTSRKLEKEDIEILYDIHNLILKSDNNLKPYESYILDKIFEDEDLFLENESLITKAIIELSNFVNGAILEIEKNKKKKLEENEKKINSKDFKEIKDVKKEDIKINNKELDLNNNNKKIKYKHNDLLDSDISSDE